MFRTVLLLDAAVQFWKYEACFLIVSILNFWRTSKGTFQTNNFAFIAFESQHVPCLEACLLIRRCLLNGTIMRVYELKMTKDLHFRRWWDMHRLWASKKIYFLPPWYTFPWSSSVLLLGISDKKSRQKVVISSVSTLNKKLPLIYLLLLSILFYMWLLLHV